MKLYESAIERQIAEYLALDGWYTRHFELNYSERKQLTVGEKGMPDLFAIRYHNLSGTANVLWIECKRPGGAVRRQQREWRIREESRGALVVTLGVDFEASLDAFARWYERSGLRRHVLRLDGRIPA